MEVEGRKFIEHPPLGGYGATLNTIPYSVQFVGSCLACHSAREIERGKLGEAAGYQSIREISKRLRCYACGKKDSKLLTGYFVVG